MVRGQTQTKNGGTVMKAKIDLEKFICSLMKRFYKIHNIDPLTTKCWLDKVLEDQGLEYRDGEIVEIPQDSEDERIKKEILDLISISGNGNQFEEIKDWLEYKPQGKTALETIMEEKSPVESLGISPEKYEEIINECIYGEEKTVDDVKPKFHESEWITNGDYTWKIVEVKPLDYILQSQDGNIVDDTISHVDEQFHSFTIEDAKDGDVLAFKNNIGGIIICKSPTYYDTRSYCRLISLISDNFINKEESGWDSTSLVPATKEQRDTLMMAMANAGYTFDFNKKELRKIDTLLDLLHKMPSCITVDGVDYHFVLKKTIAYMAFYEGEGEGSGKVIFWMAGEPIELLTAMLNKLKEEGLLESF